MAQTDAVRKSDWSVSLLRCLLQELAICVPWTPEDPKLLSFCSELLEMTCRLANTLKKDGVKKGDRVAIYMPMSPLLAASMLACARIGAVHR